MKLSEIKQLLAEDGIRLTKSLGQNFLHDANQLRRIIAAAELTWVDRALEIGPGLGPLTELLAEQAGKVLAVEKDARLVEVLRRRLAASHIEILCDDALAWLRREPRDWSGWKLVANLPYSVASQILVELAQAARGPDRMVATLQLEVAQRLMAQPGQADYGVLTLLVQLDYEPRAWFKIPASCFFPEPDVDSACVCLVRRERATLAPSQRPTYAGIVKRSFSQRRKMMFKLLKERWPPTRLEAAFEHLALSRQTRAESVGLLQFIQLTQLLAPHTARAPALPEDHPPEEIFDVVNPRDEVVGRNTRSEVHRLGLMHRAAHVLVFNARGEVFLQKRSLKKDRQPGLWDSSASGHLNAGEDYDACAVRELREELGLATVRLPRRLFKLSASVETDQEHVWAYRCEAEGPFRLHPDEIERGDWFAPDALDRWLAARPDEFASAFRFIWRRVRAARR